MPRTRPPYAPEFRSQMVELVRAGRTPGELAREFDPSEYTIRKWVQQADRDAGLREDGPTTEDKEEIQRLRRENRQLKVEREKKGNGLARTGDRLDPVRVFEFVKAHQAVYPVAAMCRVLGSPPAATTRG